MEPIYQYLLNRDAIIYSTAKIVNTSGRAERFNIGAKCIIGDFVFIALKRLEMVFGCQIAPHAVISGGGELMMEPYSVIGFGTQIITGTDTPKGKYMCEAVKRDFRHIIRGSVTLKRNSYIGSGVIICVSEDCLDIIIGENSVVGAFSYIDKSIEPNTIVHPKQELVYSKREI
jgi:acetyltransferase-like isoleucine patch superfamily enzyme